MTLAELLAWAESKNCGPRRRSGDCDHPACEQNDQVIAVLKLAKRFEGIDEDGHRVRGWLLPDLEP